MKEENQPNQLTFEKMSLKLSNKLKRTCAITIETWSHTFQPKPETFFQISLLPGFKGENCTQYRAKTWQDFINRYHDLTQTKEEVKK
jgi:hypothetical protein